MIESKTKRSHRAEGVRSYIDERCHIKRRRGRGTYSFITGKRGYFGGEDFGLANLGTTEINGVLLGDAI